MNLNDFEKIVSNQLQVFCPILAISVILFWLHIFNMSEIHAKETISQRTSGNQSPTIVANGDVSIAYGLTEEDIVKLRESISQSEAIIISKILLALKTKETENSLQKRFKIYKKSIKEIQSQFESLHESYLNSFQNYREIIKCSKEPFDQNHPVFDLMHADHIFTENKRRKLKLTSKNIEYQLHSIRHEFPDSANIYFFGSGNLNSTHKDSDKELNKHEFELELDNYLARILYYFNTPNRRFDLDKKALKNQYLGNVPRYTSFNQFENIIFKELDDNKKKIKAISALDKIVIDMQNQYGRILEAYLKLIPSTHS